MINHLKRHFSIPHLSELFSCVDRTPEKYTCEDCRFQTSLMVNINKHKNKCHNPHSDIKIEEEFSNIEECELISTDIFTSFICKNCDFETYSKLVWLKHFSDGCSNSETDSIFEYKNLSITKKHTKQRKEYNFSKYVLITDKESKSVEYEGSSNKTKQVTNAGKYKALGNFQIAHKTQIKNCHMIRSHIRWFECDQCTYKSKEKGNLRKHKLAKHAASEDTQWLECDQCAYKSPLKSYLRNHKLAKHTASEDIPWFECNQCAYKSKQKSNLRQHIVARHAASEDFPWFECDQCTYRSKQKRYLRSHKLAKHAAYEDILWFECDQCVYKSKCKRNLIYHMLIKHGNSEDMYWFECDHCAYKSLRKEVLKRHKLVKHTASEDIAWFECDQCAYKSKVKSSLKRHKIAIHIA